MNTTRTHPTATWSPRVKYFILHTPPAWHWKEHWPQRTISSWMSIILVTTTLTSHLTMVLILKTEFHSYTSTAEACMSISKVWKEIMDNANECVTLEIFREKKKNLILSFIYSSPASDIDVLKDRMRLTLNNVPQSYLWWFQQRPHKS